MDKAQIVAYLMEVKNMTEEEANAHLDGLSEEDRNELESEITRWASSDEELTSEEEEEKKKLSEKEDKEEEEKKEVKLAAARTSLATLSRGFKTSVDNARLAAAKGRILTRLSRLRAQAKITPAEVKKLDLTKLSKASDESINLLLQSYEDREPVIVTGQFGSIKASSFSRLGKAQQMSKLEAETRHNMSLKRGKTDGKTKLSEGDVVVSTEGVDVSSIGDHTIDTTTVQAAYENLVSLLDQGNIDEVKAKLKALVASALAMGGTSEYTESNTLETETQLSALVDSVTKMQTQYDDLHKLAGSLVE